MSRGSKQASVAQATALRFYKVGAVSEFTELPPHVLRYWESEFPLLCPGKTRGGQRLYTAEDIELILRIKDLLYEQGFTIAGARRRLAAENSGPRDSEGIADVVDEIRREIRAILTLMEANDKR